MSSQNSSTIEILFIGNVPQPFGGVATHSWHLVTNLLRENVKVHLLDTRPRKIKEVPQGSIFYGVSPSPIRAIIALMQFAFHYPFDIFTLLRLPIKDIGKIASIWQVAQKILVKNPNISLIHAQHAFDRGYVSSFLKKQFNKKLVVTIHGAEVTKPQIFSRWKTQIASAVEASDLIITVSKYSRGHILGHFPQIAEKCMVIANGVDLELFSSHRKEPRQNEILFTGDIHYRKGVDVLLEAFIKLGRPDWSLSFIGTAGNAYQALQKRIKESNLDGQINLRLNISQHELVETYSRAMIFVFPTNDTTEGFGLVALEAMANGLAVIASDIAAIPEIVHHKKTGLLVPPGDIDALASALESLMTSEDLRNLLIGNASQALENYDWREIAQVYIEQYEKLVGLV